MAELDELMDREASTYTNEDIETIIAYVRKQLALYEGGGKVKTKAVEELDTAKLLANISARFGSAPKPAAPKAKFKRRM